MLKEIEAEKYFQRIGIKGPTRPSLDNLFDVVCAQRRSIAFENLDLMLGREISVDPRAVFDKLVRHKRGGYCFELNGLLQQILEFLGYRVRPLLARVHLRGEPGPRTHLLLLLDMEGEPWLADVGFGGPGLLEPVPFQCGRVFSQSDRQFRIVEDPHYGFMLQSWMEEPCKEKHGMEEHCMKEQWKNIFSFDLTTVNAIDVEMSNFFVSRHPSSFFTTTRIAYLPGDKRRVALMNYNFTESTPEGEKVVQLTDDSSYLDHLRQYFDIELDADYGQLKKVG